MDGWTAVIVTALAVNALSSFIYRLYRYRRKGPLGDVLGQGILGVLLLGLAGAVAAGAEWARWTALVYALLFGVVVTPLWVLAVFIPLRPGRVDHAFAAVYVGSLATIAVAALLA